MCSHPLIGGWDGDLGPYSIFYRVLDPLSRGYMDISKDLLRYTLYLGGSIPIEGVGPYIIGVPPPSDRGNTGIQVISTPPPGSREPKVI